MRKRLPTMTACAATSMLACAATLPAYTLADATRDALADAARRPSTAPATPELMSAERVVWRDGALGCPLPGMNYTQALVPGYRIRIRSGNAVLDYHGGVRLAPRLCPPGRAVEPLPDDARR